MAQSLSNARRLDRVEKALQLVVSMPPPAPEPEPKWVKRARVAVYGLGVFSAGILTEFVRGLWAALGW